MKLELQKKRLLAKRAEIRAALSLKSAGFSQREGRVAEEDQASLSHDEYISLSMNRIGFLTLRLIERALERLREGSYGRCLDCEERIAPRRLEALPWAEHCIACQDRRADSDAGDDSGETDPATLPEAA